MQEDLIKELRFAAVWTVLLNLLAWIISLWILHFDLSFLLGLLLGSLGMLGNLCLLRKSILDAVRFGKTRDLKGYLFRMLIASAVIAAGLLSDNIHPVAVILPFLYPKVIFGILSHKI